MATYTLQPNADQKADGTEVPSGSAFDRVNDGTSYPTVPDTSTDYIDLTATSQISRWDLTTQTLAGGEVVVSARVFVYLSTTGGLSARIHLRTGGDTLLQIDIPAGTAGAWYRKNVLWTLTQSQVDALNIQVQAITGSGTARIYSAYTELYTRTDVWQVANDKILQARNNANGLSASAGYMGSDQWRSIDLGSGRSLILGADSGWASAAGQQQPFGTNKNSGAATRAEFLRNTVHTLSAYNVDTATLTSYKGATAGPDGRESYFPSTTLGGQDCLRWAYNGFVLSGVLYVTGALVTLTGLTSLGSWVGKCTNFSGTPDTWSWTYLSPFADTVLEVNPGHVGVVDGGDGFLYFFSTVRKQTVAGFNDIAAARVSTTDISADRWFNGQWFNGTGWVRMPRRVGGGRGFGRRPPRPTTIAGPVTGTVHRRPDGKWQYTGVEEQLLVGGPPFHLSVRLTAGTTLGAFGSATQKFLVPEGENFPYVGGAHPQLTWTGKAADDQVWSYFAGQIGEGGDDNMGTNGFPRFVKALAV